MQKGEPKVGGRQRGTPNKKTEKLQAIIEVALGMTMPQKIVELMAELDVKDQVQTLLQLMPYVYSKRKIVEVETDLIKEVFEINFKPAIVPTAPIIETERSDQ